MLFELNKEMNLKKNLKRELAVLKICFNTPLEFLNFSVFSNRKLLELPMKYSNNNKYGSSFLFPPPLPPKREQWWGKGG